MILFVSDSDVMELNDGLDQLVLNEQQQSQASSSVSEESSSKSLEMDQVKIRRSTRIINKSIPIPKIEIKTVVKSQWKTTNTEQELAKIYLEGKGVAKKKTASLETIFEEPKIVNNSPQYTSGKKFRRMISFHESGSVIAQHRVKKRHMKAKQVLGNNKKGFKQKKISQEVFMKRLKTLLDNDSDDSRG
ncbi:uncharacterized protein [Onthophagus taurus]|uniref:uncharacterized protein n=1 Tax=Onthophagus taurus TaxID=166361 RepID=UPI0039BEC6EA